MVLGERKSRIGKVLCRSEGYGKMDFFNDGDDTNQAETCADCAERELAVKSRSRSDCHS